jgi:hypothetical protein
MKSVLMIIFMACILALPSIAAAEQPVSEKVFSSTDGTELFVSVGRGIEIQVFSHHQYPLFNFDEPAITAVFGKCGVSVGQGVVDGKGRLELWSAREDIMTEAENGVCRRGNLDIVSNGKELPIDTSLITAIVREYRDRTEVIFPSAGIVVTQRDNTYEAIITVMERQTMTVITSAAPEYSKIITTNGQSLKAWEVHNQNKRRGQISIVCKPIVCKPLMNT